MNFQLPKLALIIDIETLSCKSNAIITEAAFVMVGLDDQKLHFCIDAHFNIEQQIQAGFDYDEGTANWVKDNLPNQEYEKRMAQCAAVEDNVEALSELLSRIEFALKKDKLTRFNVYCKGANFDFPIFQNFFNHFKEEGKKLPWDFRQELCIRIFESMLFNKDSLEQFHEKQADGIAEFLGRPLVKHNAVDDALLESAFLIEVYKFLDSKL